MQLDFQNFMNFFALLGKIKQVVRYEGRYWNDYGIARKESVPDHVWRMLLMSMYLQNKLSISYDLTKVFKIILVHDIAEILTGDTNATNPDSKYNAPETKQEKQDAERKAVNEIFSQVDDLQFAQECIALWEEYEEHQTNEGKVAKCLDKLEAFLHAYESSGAKLYPEHYEFCLKLIDSQKGLLEDFDVLFENIKQEFIKNYTPFSPL